MPLTAKDFSEVFGSAQGQCFELLVPASPGAPLEPLAVVAGSSLNAVAKHEWSGILRELREPSKNRDAGVFKISREWDRPLFWRSPTETPQLRNFIALEQLLARLRPCVEVYCQGIESLRERLKRVRSVEEWEALSNARLQLVRSTAARVLEWARAGTDTTAAAPTLLLTGSAV
jgi:hypothetical protein